MIGLLTPPVFEDKEKTLTAHHLFTIIWTFVLACWLSVFIAFVIPVTLLGWLIVITVIQIAGFILLILNKRGHVRLAGHLLIFVIWAIATGLTLTGGGTNSNAMTIYFIIVLIAGLVQRGKAVFITALLCSFTGLFLVYLEYTGLLPENQVPHTPMTQWIAVTIYMAIIISLQYLVSRTIKKTFMSSNQELAERQRIEIALRESEEKYRTLVENANEAIHIAQDGILVYANPRLSSILEVPTEELIGKPFLDFLHPECKDVIAEYHRRRLSGESLPNTYEFRIISRKGNIKWLYTSVKLVQWSGRPASLNMLMDITERKVAEEKQRELEERLRRSEKMEALGLLAGGVAHDLNNALGILVGYAELLHEGLKVGDPRRRDARNIIKGGERAAAIAQDLLTLARRGVQTKTVVNLNKIIREYLYSPEYLKLTSFQPGIRVRTELEEGLLPISGSPVHLSKTLMNLISNAEEAMTSGGEIVVRTENRYLDKPVSGYDELQEGDYVVLTVSDQGEGISDEDMKRIFEPFYTKKVMGRSGTGLGLSVVWGTVKDHDGYIDVQSQKGKGTMFHLYFPITQDKESEKESVIMADEYMGKSEKILIVDDIEAQRDLACRILSKLNYNVTTVSSGEEAVTYLKENDADLIVLDMIMDPGIDGFETYRRISEFNPGQKAVIVSGFAETDRVKMTQSLGAGTFVRKPYLRERIGLAVRKELDAKH